MKTVNFLDFYSVKYNQHNPTNLPTEFPHFCCHPFCKLTNEWIFHSITFAREESPKGTNKQSNLRLTVYTFAHFPFNGRSCVSFSTNSYNFPDKISTKMNGYLSIVRWLFPLLCLRVFTIFLIVCLNVELMWNVSDWCWRRADVAKRRDIDSAVSCHGIDIIKKRHVMRWVVA